ncbi:MAG: sulfatase-like hydrolase/transferase [Planctomycetota bacterium]
MPSPNILLITTDEHNARALGYAGDPVIRTPNIDRLAEEGTVFERAYTTRPLCTPARATVWTGQHPLTHGVRGNMYTGRKDGGVRDGAFTFSKRLRRAGYETGLIGKRHLAFRNEADIGLDHQELAESKFNFNPPGVKDDYRRWLEEQGHSNQEITTWERDDLDEEYRRHYGAIRFPLEERYYVDSWVGRRAVQWLRRPRQRPFFLWVSFCSPHHPWDPPERYDEMYDPGDIPLPERRERELHDKPRRQLEYLQHLGRGLPATTRDEEMFVEADLAYEKIPESIQRKMISRYYGTITLVDDRIGRILATLEEDGRLDDTVVIFTSDHGDHLGEHWLWFKGVTRYEALVRVPFVVRMPGAAAGGRRSEALISLSDLAPTFLEWAGLEPAEACDGTSIRPLLEDPCAALREDLLIGTDCLVTPGWKYVRNSDDVDELYDLKGDPGELYNLHGRNRHAEVERNLRGRLERRLEGLEGSARSDG